MMMMWPLNFNFFQHFGRQNSTSRRQHYKFGVAIICYDCVMCNTNQNPNSNANKWKFVGSTIFFERSLGRYRIHCSFVRLQGTDGKFEQNSNTSRGRLERKGVAFSIRIYINFELIILHSILMIKNLINSRIDDNRNKF